MRCPIDNRELVLSDRQGIEIDYCPECRGVWLDRGELDKLIERSAPSSSASGYDEPRDRGDRGRSDRDSRRYDDEQIGSRGHASKPKKRESFLSEIFDFG